MIATNYQEAMINLHDMLKEIKRQVASNVDVYFMLEFNNCYSMMAKWNSYDDDKGKSIEHIWKSAPITKDMLYAMEFNFFDKFIESIAKEIERTRA